MFDVTIVQTLSGPESFTPAIQVGEAIHRITLEEAGRLYHALGKAIDLVERHEASKPVECPTCKGAKGFCFSIHNPDPQEGGDFDRACPDCHGDGVISAERYAAGDFLDLTEREAIDLLTKLELEGE